MARPRAESNPYVTTFSTPKGLVLEGDLKLGPAESVEERRHRLKKDFLSFLVKDLLATFAAFVIVLGVTIYSVWALMHPSLPKEDRQFATSLLASLGTAVAGFVFGKATKWIEGVPIPGGMRNIKLLLSYDGTDFSGWQRQPDRRTVQQVLEEAIGRLTGVEATTNASGRTDAGVHALGQVVHFYTAARHAPEVFVKALNAMLPHDARVRGAWEVPQAFHATLDAKAKRYRYVIDNGVVADPFQTRYAWHVYRPLDVPAMHRAAQALAGRHDFHSFETQWPNRTSSVRTIADIAVRRDGDRVTIEAEADGFLYNMVRSIAGTLVLVGNGRWAEARVGEALRAEDRRAAGPTAPPQGLFLVRVRYSHDDHPGPT